MTTQIDEGHDVLRLLCDLSPRLIFSRVYALKLHLLVLLVEAHNLLTNARGSPVFAFMHEVEHAHSSAAASIIQCPLSKYANKRTLA